MSVRSILMAAALAAVPTHLSAQEALKRVDNASVARGRGCMVRRLVGIGRADAGH